jgi:hypothetical protein
MTEHKLDERGALNCGAQLVDALARIEARHGWSPADTVAVAVAAFTEAVGQRLGPAQTVRFFQDHAQALADEHKRRATI